MVRIEGTPREISYGEGGALQHVVDLQVSTVAELPGKGDVVGGGKVMPGSTAQIIQADEPTWVTLDDNGTWYPEQSSSASTLSAPLAIGKSPTLAKAVADSDGEYIDLTEPDVDAIRDELEGGEDDA